MWFKTLNRIQYNVSIWCNQSNCTIGKKVNGILIHKQYNYHDYITMYNTFTIAINDDHGDHYNLPFPSNSTPPLINNHTQLTLHLGHTNTLIFSTTPMTGKLTLRQKLISFLTSINETSYKNTSNNCSWGWCALIGMVVIKDWEHKVSN